MAKILVVDDEVLVREFLKAALKGGGHEVSTAPTAEQALAEARVKTFDLIILDVRMPGEDGFSLLEKIRKSQNRVPVVIYSGNVTAELEIAARKAGANEVLEKNGDVDTLTHQVTNILKAKGRLFNEPGPPKAKRILIVDDEPSIRRLLVHFFKTKNYDTLEAEDGARALELVREQVFSVVLLDIQMPAMDGLTTLKKIFEIRPSQSVVMVTGEIGDEKVKQAVSLGAYGYILKPFDFLYLELVVMSKLAIAETPPSDLSAEGGPIASRSKKSGGGADS